MHGKQEVLHVTYINIENLLDRVGRDAMWRVLDMYGAMGSLLDRIESLYSESDTCLRSVQTEVFCFK